MKMEKPLRLVLTSFGPSPTADLSVNSGSVNWRVRLCLLAARVSNVNSMAL